MTVVGADVGSGEVHARAIYAVSPHGPARLFCYEAMIIRADDAVLSTPGLVTV